MKNKGRNTTKIGLRLEDWIVEALQIRATQAGLTVGGYIKTQICKTVIGSGSTIDEPTNKDIIKTAAYLDNLPVKNTQKYSNSKLAELRAIVKAIEDKPQTQTPRPPLYNPAVHRPGDRVLVRQGRSLIETIVAEVDADGNAVPKW